MEILKKYLNNDETIVEIIRPDCSKIFSVPDFFLIPFSILWTSFAILFEISAIVSQAPIIFKIWGIPFIIVGLYIIFGRFIYKKWKNKNTIYAITNMRLMVLTKNILGQYKFSSKFINGIETLEIEGNPTKIGAVVFQHHGYPYYKIYQNSGFDFFLSGFTGFYNIYNPKQIYDKIMEIKSTQK